MSYFLNTSHNQTYLKHTTMQLENFKTLVIEDEKEARDILVKRLHASKYWNVLHQTDNIAKSFLWIQHEKFDIVFLDIKIKQGSALNLLDQLSINGVKIPPIVILTELKELDDIQMVINAYKEVVIKILIKPFWTGWELTEIEILQKIIEFKMAKIKKQYEGKITFRIKNETYYLKPDEIYYIEIEEKSKNATRVGLFRDKLVVNKSIAKWIEVLPKPFIQISRQTIINIDHIIKYDHQENTIQLRALESKKFYVGRGFRGRLCGETD